MKFSEEVDPEEVKAKREEYESQLDILMVCIFKMNNSTAAYGSRMNERTRKQLEITESILRGCKDFSFSFLEKHFFT